MPIYTFKCKSCNVEKDQLLKIADMDKPLHEPCPECGNTGTVDRVIYAPKIAYNHPGSMKTTDSFNDRLKEIKKKVPERFKGAINNNIR